jgi:hypothetical protein
MKLLLPEASRPVMAALTVSRHSFGQKTGIGAGATGFATSRVLMVLMVSALGSVEDSVPKVCKAPLVAQPTCEQKRDYPKEGEADDEECWEAHETNGEADVFHAEMEMMLAG